MDKFLKLLQTPIKELWANNKIFLICFGVLILIAKFHDVIFDAIVNSSKKLIADSQKKSDVLKTEETVANQKANTLIDEAKKLDDNKEKVDEDWYKK